MREGPGPGAPLSHLRVVDLTDLRGALAGRLLADLGAAVVKVEPPGGDPDRLRPPFAGGVPARDRSLPFLYRHANKRGATLDLDAPADRSRLDELCQGADILIENLAAPRRAGLGLEPEDVRRHPHLIHVAIADFGLSGPRASWRLEPLPAFAASGGLHASGFPELPPCWLPGYVAHDAASAFAVAGALAALLDRQTSGLGQRVEVSVQEAALHCLVPWTISLADYARRYPGLAASPGRNGNATYFTFETRDGWIRTVAGTARHWRRFVSLLGDPEVFEAPDWDSTTFRIANQDAIELVASEILSSQPRQRVLAEARRIDMPMVPVNSPDEFVDEEQTRARGTFRRTGFPNLEAAPLCAAPFRFSTLAVSLDRPAPPVDIPCEAFPPREALSPSGSGSEAKLPLAGLRVVHLGVGAVVPELCGLLGELGAEVIKIESRASLDFLRRVSFEPDQPNRAWGFNAECRGQKSVCLDLRTERGRELALRLCAAADVVAENSRGGVVAGWGLDYEDVRRLRPDVIYLSSQAYGRGGPLGEASGFGPLNCAFSGVAGLWNHPGAPAPTGSSLNHPDHIAGKIGAVAVLAALDHRRRTGEGQFIDMAQTDAAAFLAGEFYLEGAATGRTARAEGNAVAYACPHGVYPCAGDDRWVAIAVVGEPAWSAFRRVAGWDDDPELAALDARLAARERLDERVARWTRERSPDEIAEALQAAGVSAMPVQSPDDHRGDPHLAARGAIVAVEHPEMGVEHHIANPLRMTRTPVRHAGAAPLLGQHTGEVLRDVLGIGAEAFEKLTADGVCR